jgi:hypothetical protein
MCARTTPWMAGLLFALMAGSAVAAPVIATSYAMPNGDGQASGGTFNYWDRNYSGTGSTTTDGAALTGGLGKLTDGVISTSVWNTVSNVAGTGEYVGWRGSATGSPLIDFSFAGSPTIDAIDIYLDNSQFGGVFAPVDILIDGVSRAFTAPAAGTVGRVSFTGLNLTGGSHTIQFVPVGGANTSNWVFVSEIVFDGGVRVVPEPGAGLLAALGLLPLAWGRWRGRAVPSRSAAARRLAR